jgi:pilus assembly protein CpaF
MSRWEWQEDTNPFGTPVQTKPDRFLDAIVAEERNDAEADRELVHSVHQKLISEIDPQKLSKLSPEEAHQAVVTATRRTLAEMAPNVVGESRDLVLAAVADEVLGLGPIEKLVRDPAISEVMVNAPDRVFYEEGGLIYKSRIQFRDDDHIMRIIQRIVAPLGRRVDESSPFVDARLPDGSRVNVIIPPIAFEGPVITIRKFLGDKYTIEDLVRVETLTDAVADFLALAIEARLNIVISGGTGSGKTTLLNSLSAYIGDRERIVTIEDPAELRLQQEHVIGLEVRPANIEGRNEVTQRDLVRNSLRMRPDRIIVGEVRGGEAFDMLQAMNTGHEGSLTTVHANSPRDALARIENMVMMAGYDLPLTSIREQIASAIHLVLQIARLSDGTRRILSISEITGHEGNMISLQDLFVFERWGVDDEGRIRGSLIPTGLRPHFQHMFAAAGIDLGVDMFLRPT